MPDIETYTETAIEQAAITLLWQAPDATEDGNGFPIGEGGNEYSARVVEEVPSLTEAVTAFIRDTWNLLQRGEVDAEQCGHDIILTANGHGAGFWDRGLDMPATDDEAYTAWKTIHDRMPYPQSRKLWEFWLDRRRPAPADRPQTVGDALTQAARGYSFDAEFALDSDGDVTWLCVENTVLVDELGWSSEPEPDTVRYITDLPEPDYACHCGSGQCRRHGQV
jgi:hypothetical protein